MAEESMPLYQKLVVDIKERIEKGLYRTGEKIDSLNLLCTRYGVSKITAIRAMDELQNIGLLRKVAGKGAYVTGMRYEEQSEHKFPDLRKIIIYSKEYIATTADSAFNKKIYNSIVSRSCELGLDVEIAQIRESEVFGAIKLPVIPRPEEGIIALARDSVISMLYLFTNPNCRRVLVDTSVAGVPNVLSDNFSGVLQMLRHLKELGHRHILFAARFADGQNFVNENERLEAFVTLCELMELRAETVVSGNYLDIYRILARQDRPTAVFFSRDDPALKLIDDLTRAGICVPEELSVVGFDNYASEGFDLECLSTVRVATSELGRQAVESLRRPLDPLWRVPLTQRVSTHLTVRKSSGPASSPFPIKINRK